MTLQEVKIDISATDATHVKVGGVCYEFDRLERGEANTDEFTTHDTCACLPAPSPTPIDSPVPPEPSPEPIIVYVPCSPQPSPQTTSGDSPDPTDGGGSPDPTDPDNGSPDPNVVAKLYSPNCGFSGDTIVVNDDITAPIIAYGDKCYVYQQQVNQEPAVNNIQAGYVTCSSCYDDFGSPGGNPSPTGDFQPCPEGPFLIINISGGGSLGIYDESNTPAALCPSSYARGPCPPDPTPSTLERWQFNTGGDFIELYAGISTNQSWGSVVTGSGGERKGSYTPSGCLQGRLFGTYDMGDAGNTTVTIQQGPAGGKGWCDDCP